jgi:hypothetical protein
VTPNVNLNICFNNAACFMLNDSDELGESIFQPRAGNDLIYFIERRFIELN